jgi:two-component system LytT family sensor kinase
MTRVQRHLAFWIAYVLFKAYLNVSDNPDLPLSVYGQVLLGQLVFLIVKIPLVYFSFYVIDRYLDMRWSLAKSIIVLAVTLFVGSVGIGFCNHFVILPFIVHSEATTSVFAIGSLIYHTFTLTFVAGIAISIHLFRRQTQSRMREVILQKEKTETELKYLKGQLNPHFLFNTLNNIYSLAMKGSGQTSEAILRLSKMMRFVLYESGNANILLKDELALIQDYIKLERLRYTNRLEVKYSEQLDNNDQKIAPLLLIHFVENAFKHGVSESRSESFVHVDVILVKNNLKVMVSNSKSDEAKMNGVSIGMENIRRQLDILYPQHRLDIKNDDHKHLIELTIQFTD